MVETAALLSASLGLLVLVLFGCFGTVSLWEGEQRASRLFFVAAVMGAGPLLVASILSPPIPTIALLVVAVVGIGVVARCLNPSHRPVEPGGCATQRVDERDIMFARGRLRPGSSEFDAYYRMCPENRAGDDHTRSLPGLLSPKAEKAEPLAFAAADACFMVTEALRDRVDGEVAAIQQDRSPEEWTDTLKQLAVVWGAFDVGVAELEPAHIYTNIGRGTGTWGSEITLDHRWAFVFTVEMDHKAIAQAPEAPVVAESARQYVETAKIAIQLASVIRDQGWPARAHTDGNYRVIAPLVARAAGLGEIGRMGLLMTPRLGPRVRIGVVTTDIPLVADHPGDDLTLLDFCMICKKCATNCPVGAIPHGDRTPIDEGARWAIDSETCFRYWNLIGTDCATCLKVCPYSHPDNWMHNLVRKAIRVSPGTRNLLLWMDDVVYGRKP